MATAGTSAPRSAAAPSISPISARSPQAADRLGYFGVLLPTGKSCEDSWIVASALVAADRAAPLPGRGPARACSRRALAARMTATLDRLSNGRLLINVVTGGDPVENKGDGIFLSHAERYEVTREFLHVYKALLAGETVNYRRQAHPHRGRPAALRAGAGAASAALFRRLVRRRRSTSPPRRSTNI